MLPLWQDKVLEYMGEVTCKPLLDSSIKLVAVQINKKKGGPY